MEEGPKVQEGEVCNIKIEDRDEVNCILTIETKYIVEVSLKVPSEYSLENDLVMLMEWKNITGGRIGDLIEERVYVDVEEQTLVLPESLSPLSRVRIYIQKFRRNHAAPTVNTSIYLILVLLTAPTVCVPLELIPMRQYPKLDF